MIPSGRTYIYRAILDLAPRTESQVDIAFVTLRRLAASYSYRNKRNAWMTYNGSWCISQGVRDWSWSNIIILYMYTLKPTSCWSFLCSGRSAFHTSPWNNTCLWTRRQIMGYFYWAHPIWLTSLKFSTLWQFLQRCPALKPDTKISVMCNSWLDLNTHSSWS